MSINISKTKIMNKKGNMTATLHGNPVKITKSEEDLGIIVNNCLTWTDKSNKRCSNGMNTLYQFKRKSTPDDKCKCVQGLCGAHCHIRIPSLDAKQIRHGSSKRSKQKQQNGSCQRMYITKKGSVFDAPIPVPLYGKTRPAHPDGFH